MNRRRNIIYLTCGFIVFISVLILFIILPLFFEIVDRADELIVKKKNLNYMIEKAQVPNNRINDLEAILNEVQDLYIDPKRPLEESHLLNRIAIDNGLDIEINIADEPKDDGRWSYLTFMISIQGDSDGVIGFVEKIQNAKWIAAINQLNVRRANERDMGEWEDSVVADISLNIFFRK